MTTEQLILDEFSALYVEGRDILKKCGWDGSDYHHFPDDVDYIRFRTRALNLVRRVMSEESDHYRELRQIAEDKQSVRSSYYMKDCVGAVEAALADYKTGLLFNVKSLISAEILSDFIEQAEALHSEKYIGPAASLIGAVLEDALRKLSDKHKIGYPTRTKVDALNTELAKNDIYNKLVQKQITAWADIRNNADHGRFDQFKADDVRNMIVWVKQFSADYLK